MASAGTLLSDLDTQGGGVDTLPNANGTDGDLVQKILADMSVPSQRAPPPPPPMPQQQAYSHQQMPSTMMPMTMDSRIPNAHIIGNEHPTPADFAAAMQGMGMQRPQESMMGTMPGYQGNGMPSYAAPSKNIYGRVLDEIKIPFLVTLLFFLFSLPPIRILIAHYIPAFIKHTGEFTIPGLLATSGIVGLTFWVLQRVIAPLLSL